MTPLLLSAIAAAAQSAEPPSQHLVVPHPRIACWIGERSWSPPEEPLSRHMYFGTQGDTAPERIEHNRDEFFEGQDLVQVHNFIDYHFANDGNALLARTYLDDVPTSVAIRFRRAVPPGNSNEARRLIASDVMCYLQKRFRSIDALTSQGYIQIWTMD